MSTGARVPKHVPGQFCTLQVPSKSPSASLTCRAPASGAPKSGTRPESPPARAAPAPSASLSRVALRAPCTASRGPPWLPGPRRSSVRAAATGQTGARTAPGGRVTSERVTPLPAVVARAPRRHRACAGILGKPSVLPEEAWGWQCKPHSELLYNVKLILREAPVKGSRCFILADRVFKRKTHVCEV